MARDDIADVAVEALLDPQHEGRAYEVTGREAFTLAEAAEILTRHTGREVRYVEETIEEARASRAPSGAPDWEIEGWVTTYTSIAAGELDVVTDTVARVAGHEPQTLVELLEARSRTRGRTCGADERQRGWVGVGFGVGVVTWWQLFPPSDHTPATSTRTHPPQCRR